MNTLLVAIAEHGFRPPRRVSLAMISTRQEPQNFSLPTFLSKHLCPSVVEQPKCPSLVILRSKYLQPEDSAHHFSEGLRNNQMLLDCANTHMQDHGCLCLGKVGRIHVRFFWNKCMCFEESGVFANLLKLYEKFIYMCISLRRESMNSQDSEILRYRKFEE